MKYSLNYFVACVASVSVWFRSKNRPWKGIFGFDRARNETRTKKWKREDGEGKEGNACRQTPRFWKPAFASERSTILGDPGAVSRVGRKGGTKVFEYGQKSPKSRGLSASVFYLSSPPLPALLLAPFFARSLTLVPHSLLLNRTETLATEANYFGTRFLSTEN